jgi:TolA-binding protein
MKNITKISAIVAALLLGSVSAVMATSQTDDIPADKTGCAFNYQTKEACAYLVNINDKEKSQILNQQQEITALNQMIQLQKQELQNQQQEIQKLSDIATKICHITTTGGKSIC